MEILNKYAPVEAYLILNESDSEYKETLKFILIDLITKQVLELDRRIMQSDPRSPVREVPYLCPGKNYATYNPRPYEVPFLKHFVEDQEVCFLLRHIVRAVYQEFYTWKNLAQNNLIGSDHMKDLFGRSFI